MRFVVAGLALALGAFRGVHPPAVAGSAPGPPRASADTILDVARGERLVVENLAGRILVESWERDELEVWVESGGIAVEARRAGGTVRVRGRNGRGWEAEGAYRITVPRWMGVEVTGVNLSVRARELGGELSIRTVEGAVLVRGSRGPVEARSVDGFVEVEDVVGDVTAGSADDDVILRRVLGSVKVENVDGDIRLEGVDGERVEAVTVDGDVDFEGTLRPGGHYRLRTHDGDLTVLIPDPPDARVTVSTHDGEFRSDFAVTLDRLRGGERFTFTLGQGSATLDLEAFDGEIRLMRR